VIDVIDIVRDRDLYDACISIAENGVARREELISILGDACAVDELLEALRLHGFVVHMSDDVLPTRDLDFLLELVQEITLRNPRRLIEKIQQLYPELRRIAVIRDNLTGEFFKCLHSVRTAGRISICSPWINMNNDQFETLAFLLQQSVLLEEPHSINVVMLPSKPSERHHDTTQEMVRRFAELGITVLFSKGLHAKLYVRTPSSSNGSSFAVIGSQNLTRSTYTELGLLIKNERRLVEDLQAAFFEIARGEV